jgi:hypothetical protein
MGSSAAEWALAVATAVAGLGAGVAATVAARIERRAGLGGALQARRLAAYQELFSVLKPFALDGRPIPTAADRRRVAEELTDWYYHTGGAVVSAHIRDAVLDFRAALIGTLDRNELQASLKKADPFRDAASSLRTVLTEEVFARNRLAGGASPDARAALRKMAKFLATAVNAAAEPQSRDDHGLS